MDEILQNRISHRIAIGAVSGEQLFKSLKYGDIIELSPDSKYSHWYVEKVSGTMIWLRNTETGRNKKDFADDLARKYPRATVIHSKEKA